MKILILYFSGTGNTHYIASYIHSHLRSENFPSEISCETIENFPPERVSQFDLLCFGFPVFELNSPAIVREYLSKIPNIKQKGVFLFCTMGFAAGNAFRKNFKYFRNKGYLFLGHIAVKMPGTDGLLMLKEKSRYVQMAIQKDYAIIPSLDDFIQEITQCANRLVAGEDLITFQRKLPHSIIDLFFGWVFHLLYIILVKIMKKQFRVDDNCNLCKLCVKICPVQNIFLDEEKIHFSDKCNVCLRCIHQCPQKAIQIGNISVDKFRWHGPKGNYNPLEILHKK
ncbi:MAG: EFR1 family ferrodoxin [Promethearchaeota archaeon]